METPPHPNPLLARGEREPPRIELGRAAFHCPHLNAACDIARKSRWDPRNEIDGVTFSCMDRVFLAVIASGLLLAATSMSLLVATGGGTTVAELNVPSTAVLVSSIRPHRSPEKTTLVRNDSVR